MLAKKSSFILKDFLLLTQRIEFIAPNDKKLINIQEVFDSYDVDIDFVMQKLENKLLQLFVKIGINSGEQKLPGYSIFSEGVGIFEFDPQIQLTEREKFSFIYTSGISICINSLRSIISNTTSHSPFGKYSLPSIDINELLIAKGIINPKPLK